MNISKTKRSFICWHTLFAVISAALGAVILHFALPGHYFGGYPFIPVYFYFFGLASIYMFDACRRHAVTLPGMIGSFSILPGHAPIVSSLKAGTLSYTTMEGEEHTMDIQGGFVEMSDGTVSACVS